jgi:hypothetical protein
MRSGNYEVDGEGNLVEVGSAAPAGDETAAPTPIPVRRAMRVYGFAQLLSFAILLGTAIAMPDIRAVLLLVAVVYAGVALVLHRLYRRALMRRYAKIAKPSPSATAGSPG